MSEPKYLADTLTVDVRVVQKALLDAYRAEFARNCLRGWMGADGFERDVLRRRGMRSTRPKP
jgi:hypothetical protein